MALLSFSYDRAEFKSWYKLIDMFPTMNAQILGFIGYQGKNYMKQNILSGQLLQYRANNEGGGVWHDRMGRPKVSYRIYFSRRYVRIASYPANLFSSKARKLRSGATEARLRIYETLGTYMDSNMQRILDKYEAKYLEGLLRKFDADPKSRRRY
jgi:hypothetical protein